MILIFFPLVVKVPHCWCCLKEYDCQSKAAEDTLLTGVRKGFYGQRNAVYLFNINVCNFLGTQLCLKLILMIKLLFFLDNDVITFSIIPDSFHLML